MTGLEMGLLGASSFAQVFLLGLQSKLVQGSRYVLAGVNSLLITTAGYVFAKSAATGDPAMFFAVSAPAGSLGIMLSILVHDRFLRPKSPASRPEPPYKPWAVHPDLTHG